MKVVVEPTVQLQKIEKNFGTRKLFGGLEARIGKKEFVTFLGPSGCGKSTLLRIIAGLEKPDRGKVQRSSFVCSLGLVFQEPRLLGWRTVAENIRLPGELAGSPLKKAEIEKLLIQVRLSPEISGLFPRELSGGMKMRVSLARALSLEPRLLLMDEPLAALDEVTRLHLQEEIRRIFEGSELTVVFVTHSVSEAVFLSDRIFLLNPHGAIAKEFVLDLPSERKADLRKSFQYFDQVNQITDSFSQMRWALT